MDPLKVMRSTLGATATETAVTATTAASGPGIFRTAAGEELPRQQDCDDGQTQQRRVELNIGDGRWKPGEVFDSRARGLTAEKHMKLLEDDGNPNACEHRLDHHRRHRQRRPANAADTHEQLHDAGSSGDCARHLPAELINQTGNDDGQAGGRAAHL